MSSVDASYLMGLTLISMGKRERGRGRENCRSSCTARSAEEPFHQK
jgi:hypothetical protein